MARWKARRVLVKCNWTSSISYGWGATTENVSKLAAFRRCGSVWAKISGEGVVPLPIYWYHSKGNWLCYNLAADSFYIMKLCSRLLVLYCRNVYERRQVDPHFEEVRGGVVPWLMARWKARIRLPLLALTVEALQGKTCQDSLLSGGVGQFEPRFQGEGSSLGNIFWFLQN